MINEVPKKPSGLDLNDNDQSPKHAFTQDDLNQLIINHDKFINPRGNENAKKVGCAKSDFQVLEKLGKGAHGTVFKVKSIKNEKLYVMKEINFASPGL